jgi:EamA domain-containing membrane protein RarD
MKYLSILAVVLMVSMALAADYLLKLAGSKDSIFNRYFAGGMMLYSLTAFVWYFVLRNIKFSEANVFYSIFTVLLSAVIGVVVFKEHISIIEIIAIAMAIGSLIILSRFN